MSTQPNYIRITAESGGTNYSLANGVGNWQQLTIKTLNIVCDTTAGTINIALPRIQDLRGMLELCFVIDDVAGTAGTNAITISVGSGDKINFNATSFVINSNYGKVFIRQSRNDQSNTSGNWVALHPVVLAAGNLSPLFTTTLAGSPFLPTLSFAAVAQNANLVYAGPGTGIAAAPTFRALVAADIPALPYGTGTVTTFTAGDLTPLFTTDVSSPASTPGLTFALTDAAENTVFAGPASGGTGAPAYRALVKADMIISATAALDFPNTDAQLNSDLTITLSGAVVGDLVMLGSPAAPNANTCFTAFVSAANTVTVRFNNYSSGAINPGSGDFTVAVFK